jgi:trk system potassium uptake protein TrkA
VAQSSQYIIIVGCGRLGGTLANQLSRTGHQIVAVDRRESAFDKLSADFSGFRILGDASEIEVLRQARIEQAQYVFAATTQDNLNLMVAQVAKTLFNVPHVVARVFDPLREQIYSDFGIATVSPVKLSADAFLHVLNHREA